MIHDTTHAYDDQSFAFFFCSFINVIHDFLFNSDMNEMEMESIVNHTHATYAGFFSSINSAFHG